MSKDKVIGVEVRELARARSAGLCKIRIGTLDFVFGKATSRL